MSASRASVAALVALVAALATWSVGAAATHPEDALGGGQGLALAVQLLAAVALAWGGAWLVTDGRARATGSGLIVAALALPFAVAPMGAFDSSMAFTAALLLGALPGILVVAAVALWPMASPRPVALRLPGFTLGPMAAAVRTLAVAATVGVALAPTVTFDPAGQGCTTCPRNLALFPGVASRYPEAVDARDLLLAVMGGALATGAVWRWTATPPLLRRVLGPVVVPAAAAGAAAAAAAVHRLLMPFNGFDETLTRLWLVQCGLLAATGAGVALLAAQLGRSAARVATLVLSAAPDPRLLQTELAATIGHEGLTLAFPRAGGGFVDLEGFPLQADDDAVGRRALSVMRGTALVAELRYDSRFVGAATLLKPAAAAAGLGLEHAAARARLRAEAREASLSRTRLVETADLERRRIERNLHDGAQQQLISVAVALRAAEIAERPTPDSDRLHVLEQARQELEVALGELRALARGIFPVALHDAGLLAALDELADHALRPFEIEGDVDPQRPPAAAMAVYRLVADIVSAAPDATGTVDAAVVTARLEEGSGGLRVTVDAPGSSPSQLATAVRRTADRMVALGGSLQAEPEGTRVTATLPPL